MTNLENRVMGLDGKMYEQITPEINEEEKKTSISKKVKTGTIMDGIENDLKEYSDEETKLTEDNSINSVKDVKLDDAVMKRLMAYQNRKPSIREHKKVGRNDPCPCGSQKKYKNCCLKSGKYEGLIKQK